MYFYNLIMELSKNKKLNIYVDMDGVIASYDFGKPLEFDKKRPLTTNIKTLENIDKLDNVNLNILSICRTNDQIKEKNDWLNKYAPFFKEENRNIISRENNNNKESRILKTEFIKNLKKENIILIDDDNEVLKTIKKEIDNITLFQDSELID